ncbi:hypothetical protein, partial [Salmonella sp. SAL4457]|uniref:hypothetical protein n=1 Tax=Salmonella sp. SAL4457 TaxID=3159912 RepID=UPI00397AF2A0
LMRSAPGRSTAWLRRGSYLWPLLIVMIFAFDLPLLLMLGKSFARPWPTLQHWREFATTDVYWAVLANTVRIAAVTSCLCAVLG